MAKKKKKFIQKAIKRPGALSAAAKAAGKTIDQFCQSANLTPLQRRQCNFYKNVLTKVRRKK